MVLEQCCANTLVSLIAFVSSLHIFIIPVLKLICYGDFPCVSILLEHGVQYAELLLCRSFQKAYPRVWVSYFLGPF